MIFLRGVRLLPVKLYALLSSHGHSLSVAFLFHERFLMKEREKMSIDKPLFTGNLIKLGPIDHEKDPEVVARWTHDAGFMRMMYTEPMRPLSTWQVKKKLEELEKSLEEEKNSFHFRIRALQDDRLLGFVELMWISWKNGIGNIRLGIGAEDDRHKGYGEEALSMALRYAFRELNLFRLTAIIPDYNEPAKSLVQENGIY